MSDNLKPCEICERANCSADLHYPATLRDQFAMAALTGLLSGMRDREYWDATCGSATPEQISEAVALEAYRNADEMLAVKEQKS